MGVSAGFCSKCGAQLSGGVSFCPKCGAAVTPASAVQAVGQTQRIERREKGEKNEKHEKREKHEKHEKGGLQSMLAAVVAGAVLIWLGITFYLEQNGNLASDIWGAYFLAGVGAILILDGLVLYSRRHAWLGPLAGGACALVLGAGSILGHEYRFSQDVWPLVIVALGICVIVLGMVARSRVPKPQSLSS